MTAFRCIPIATSTADRFRQTGLNDSGNTVRRIVATEDFGPNSACLSELNRAGSL